MYRGMDDTSQDIKVCVEMALSFIKQGKLVEAQQRLFDGLSQDPFNPRARILLARVFFELKQLPFAIRELEHVYRELPDNKYVKNLIEKLAPEKVSSTAAGIENTLAEVDFDIGDIENLEKE